jgi:membrane fusion protein, multidrug efflux system
MPAGSGSCSTALEHEQPRTSAPPRSRAADRAGDRRHRHSSGSDGGTDEHRKPAHRRSYVSANVIGIAPHVQGPLVQLNVVDNQPVEENDLLFVVDPRPYEAELERARGELILAQAEVGGIEQAIAAARAEVARLRADTAYARTHAGRLEPLLGGRFISADQYQEAVTKAASLDAAVQHAQSQLAQQQQLLAQHGDVNGRLETAKARVRLAELNVEYCYVRAPFKGLVTNLNISVGDYAHIGERVFALVDRRMWYVLGNFRETLLPAIKPGMEARVNLVGDPGRTFSRRRARDRLERSVTLRAGNGALAQD